MAYAFGLLAAGTILLVAGVKNTSISDQLRGVISSATPGPGERGFLRAILPDITGQVGAAAAAGAGSKRGAAAAASGVASSTASGVASFDGKPVAKWIIPWLQRARASKRWRGTVTSGYRTPEYSESLCIERCGQPSCPGTCAGKTSNHSGRVFPQGAVDVSDPAGFAAAMRAVHGPLRNALPSDPVHFSVSGR